MKRKQTQEPIVHMKKYKVEEKRLGEYVLLPADNNISLKKEQKTFF